MSVRIRYRNIVCNISLGTIPSGHTVLSIYNVPSTSMQRNYVTCVDATVSERCVPVWLHFSPPSNTSKLLCQSVIVTILAQLRWSFMSTFADTTLLRRCVTCCAVIVFILVGLNLTNDVPYILNVAKYFSRTKSRVDCILEQWLTPMSKG